MNNNSTQQGTRTVEQEHQGGERVFYKGTVEYETPLYAKDPRKAGAIVTKIPVFVCPVCLEVIKADYEFEVLGKCPKCGTKHKEEDIEINIHL